MTKIGFSTEAFIYFKMAIIFEKSELLYLYCSPKHLIITPSQLDALKTVTTDTSFTLEFTDSLSVR